MNWVVTLTLSAAFPSPFDAFVVDGAVSLDVELFGWMDDDDDSVMADNVDVDDDVEDIISSAIAFRAAATTPISFPIWIWIWCGPFPFEIVLYLLW